MEKQLNIYEIRVYLRKRNSSLHRSDKNCIALEVEEMHREF